MPGAEPAGEGGVEPTMKPALLGICVLLLGCTEPPRSTSSGGALDLLVDETRVAFRDPRVLSVADDNSRFELTCASRELFDTGQHHVVAFARGDLRIPANSWGRSGDESWFVFALTASQAASLAGALGVPVRERAPWQGELAAKVEFAVAPTANGEHLPMRFTLTNTGPAAVWFLDGGRNRNELGRDDRFHFDIERGGERLQVRQVNEFGGMATYRNLAPGSSWTFEPDLAHWRVLDLPGDYTLRVSYVADLMPAEFAPGEVLPLGYHAHLQRTRTVTASLAFTVR